MSEFSIGNLVIGKPDCTIEPIKNGSTLLEVVSVEGPLFSARIIATKNSAIKAMVGAIEHSLTVDEYSVATEEDINRIKGIKKKPVRIKADKESSYFCGFKVQTANGTYFHNFNSERIMVEETDPERTETLEQLLDKYNGDKDISTYGVSLDKFEIFSAKSRESAIKSLIDFFKEFETQPYFRFMNTLGFKLAESVDEGKKFIRNYYRVCGSSYADSIVEKSKSKELDVILGMIGTCIPHTEVNSRLKIYFGPAGTGKTTEAIEECSGRVILCHERLTAADIIEDFNFVNGEATYQESMVTECMRKGLPIVLDEINLLPIDTLRFLQGILDNKESFLWKGKMIDIKKGFKIIGTMNLVVGDMICSLPDPLVDRACSIEEYKLTPKQLMEAIK